jgi:hypothetical protein
MMKRMNPSSIFIVKEEISLPGRIPGQRFVTLEIKTSEVLVVLLDRISSGKLRKSAASLNVVYLLYISIYALRGD